MQKLCMFCLLFVCKLMYTDTCMEVIYVSVCLCGPGVLYLQMFGGSAWCLCLNPCFISGPLAC